MIQKAIKRFSLRWNIIRSHWLATHATTDTDWWQRMPENNSELAKMPASEI